MERRKVLPIAFIYSAKLGRILDWAYSGISYWLDLFKHWSIAPGLGNCRKRDLLVCRSLVEFNQTFTGGKIGAKHWVGTYMERPFLTETGWNWSG